ncbi:MAG: M28 family peptidase [Patescibacteria group bacterium]
MPKTISYIRELEKKSNEGRVSYVKRTLSELEVDFVTQPFRHKLLKGENVIVTEYCGSSNKEILLTAHVNKYFSSPGANDNASGVSVLLKIAENLKKNNLNKRAGIKIIFFDLEDGLAILDGSSYFVENSDLLKTSFVFNLDGVGMGECVTISPKIKESSPDQYVNIVLKQIHKLGLRYLSFNLPPLLVEDHIPFVKRGKTAISFNLIPKEDLAYLMDIDKKSWLEKLYNILVYRGPYRKNHPMRVMRHRHNDLDTSEYIEEKSLKLAEKITMKLVDYHLRLNN